MAGRMAGLAMTALAIGSTGCASGANTVQTTAVGSSATESDEHPMDELYEAGDYAGAISAFVADESLRQDERSIYRAAVSLAMPGHAGHSRARALGLMTRLLTEYPDSDYLTEARLVIALLEEEAALIRANSRLEQELEQLKAIDLGERP